MDPWRAIGLRNVVVAVAAYQPDATVMRNEVMF